MASFTSEQVFVDVLIIGAGGAGLRAAVEASHTGASVLVISKVPPLRSHTIAAQGGMNAALGNITADDWRWHAYDTIRGADWLADQDAVAFMCAEAPEAILELEHFGMAFSRLESGKIYQRAYGGQNTDFGKGSLAFRACTVADRTGHALMYTLFSMAKKAGVQFMQDAMALDFLKTDAGEVAGAAVWQFDEGRLYHIIAKQFIIASGGYGQAWRSTTSSSICTGDGNAMALRAGACLQDMEFVQFHPTTLYGTGILITEAARGEGAYLLNGLGERFMERYAPKSMELASRDIISRAIIQEIRAGRGAGHKKDHVLLSMKHIPREHVTSMLPNVCDVAKTFMRLDACVDAIPVIPAVHYTMGGIASNQHSEVLGRSADGSLQPIPGLLVIGEAACNSVHGANRLGCNSLLDLVVFGKRAGRLAAERSRTYASFPEPMKARTVEVMDKFNALQSGKGSMAPKKLKRHMQNMMHQHANMFREANELLSGLHKIRQYEEIFAQELMGSSTSLVWNSVLLDALETENLLQQSHAVLASATFRKESRGAHFRVDFPERNDAAWLQHTTYALADEDDKRLNTRSVSMQAPSYDFSVPPELRSY